MACCLTILGSGSTGNAAHIETENTRLLIDAGLSARQIEERLASSGKDVASLHAILVTHEHSDHVQGLRVLSSRYRIPIYSNKLTREAVLENCASQAGGARFLSEWKLFETGRRFNAGDFEVEPFSIPHDATDPVGFLFHAGNRSICFLTDLGHATSLALEKARRANVLVLETNYDVKMLQNDPHRPWSLKQRISGRHGHLSNDEAAGVLQSIMSDRLEHVFLSHLSQECNLPTIASSVISAKLAELGASHVNMTVTHPVVPCKSLQLPFAPASTLLAGNPCPTNMSPPQSSSSAPLPGFLF
jgi:phosphoribosyl 1,2-cyclic phosphodiesterase